MKKTDRAVSPAEPAHGQGCAGRCKGSCSGADKAGPGRKNPARVMQELSRESHSDVLGSYTGTPADGGQPQQDADDL